MTTTTKTPRTYAEAVGLAEDIGTDELTALLAEDDNPDVFLGARRPRRIAVRAMVLRHSNDAPAFLYYMYCDRAGYTQEGTANPRPTHLAMFAPILAFRSGRVVRWVGK